MENKERILIVEDDMIIAANISLQLTKLGYEITGIESKGEQAIAHARTNVPDMILMDINLKGSIDGIETARAIRQHRNIPIIFLTANHDEATFSKARETHPHAFLSKPYSTQTLQRTIELVAGQLEDAREESNPQSKELRLIEDRIFVRHNGKLVKLMLDDILYIEAERNYCNITTTRGQYLVVCTLKALEQEMPESNFLRVHRSFVVNMYKVDGLADNHLEINRKVIPISRSYREELLARLHFI